MHLSRLRRAVAVGAFAIVCGSMSAAHANVVRTFAASGLFSDGSTLGGTLTFDVTVGNIVGVNLITTGPSSFVFVRVVNQSYTQVPGDYNVGVRNAAATEDFNFDLRDLAQTPLFAYDGGPICSSTSPCVNGRGSGLYDLVSSRGGASLISGSLTAAVPEPASFGLVMIGMAGLVGARRRRRGSARAKA